MTTPCRACGRPVIETVTATFGLVVRLDPEPTAAGCYRLLPDGTASGVRPEECGTEPLYQSHGPGCAVPTDLYEPEHGDPGA